MESDKSAKRISHYVVEKFLGAGMFAKVYLVTNEKDGKKYVIKCIGKNVGESELENRQK